MMRRTCLGFPEKFFARLNSLLPRLVDGGLRRQNQVMAPLPVAPLTIRQVCRYTVRRPVLQTERHGLRYGSAQ